MSDYGSLSAVMLWSLWPNWVAPTCYGETQLHYWVQWLADGHAYHVWPQDEPPQVNSSHSNPDTHVAGLTLEPAANNPLQSLLSTSTFVSYSLVVTYS